MAGGIEFNREKFKELILLLAERSGEDGRFGMTKLNKLLFFCDFDAFLELGHSITGARYQKLPWGPAAIEFLPIHEELLADERARLERRERGLFTQHVTVSLGADESVFSPEDKAVIESVLTRLRALDATDVSNLSHRASAGWNAVAERQIIPYESAFISTDQPSYTLVTHARRLSAERNWAEARP